MWYRIQYHTTRKSYSELTSPISYTCLLLAPEPALAGEVPEVRLGAQVLAESVCSTYPRCFVLCPSKLTSFRGYSVECPIQ